MILDERTRELIAVGASFAAHCEPCLTHHVKKATAAGATDEAVREAVEVGRAVRSGAAAAMDRFAARVSPGPGPREAGSGCGSRPETSAGSGCCP